MSRDPVTLIIYAQPQKSSPESSTIDDERLTEKPNRDLRFTNVAEK